MDRRTEVNKFNPGYVGPLAEDRATDLLQTE